MLSDPKTDVPEPAGRTLIAMVNEDGETVGAAPASPMPLPIRTLPVQYIILAFAVTAFLYFSRPVTLPLFLACLAATTLKPLMRWLGYLRVPTVPSAAIVFILLVSALGVGFTQLGRPTMRWIDNAPEHMAELRTRAAKVFPNAARMSDGMTAVTDLGAAATKTKEDVAAAPAQTVEIKDQRGTNSILNWTGTVLAGLLEVLVLIYLLLASGDMFMQKLVRVMPTLSDKKRAVEISHEIQTNISNYLFAVSVTNICLGTITAVGLYFLGVPRPAMWGMLVAVLNFVPYFGPCVGVILLAAVGLLTFDSLSRELLPAGWYLMLHLLESNFVTPIVVGRRLTLNPVAIFVSMMFWLWIWGVPGALLSAPILVCAKSICDRVPKLSYISELIGH
jgi:predicted PurR-regulated permease PerM